VPIGTAYAFRAVASPKGRLNATCCVSFYEDKVHGDDNRDLIKVYYYHIIYKYVMRQCPSNHHAVKKPFTSCRLSTNSPCIDKSDASDINTTYSAKSFSSAGMRILPLASVIKPSSCIRWSSFEIFKRLSLSSSASRVIFIYTVFSPAG